jgi:hypothetical protein
MLQNKYQFGSKAPHQCWRCVINMFLPTGICNQYLSTLNITSLIPITENINFMQEKIDERKD